MTITDTTTPTRSRRRPGNPQLDERLLGMLQVPREHLPHLGAGETGEMYEMIVGGRCLEPLLLDGDHVVIAPGMRYQAGDLVAIWPSDSSKIPQIKRMVMPPFQGWRAACLHPGSTALPVCIVEMLNPARQFRIDLSKVAAIHRVAAWFGADRVGLIGQPDNRLASALAPGAAAMSADTTYSTPSSRSARPVRSRRTPARWRHRRRLVFINRRLSIAPLSDPSGAAAAALNVLMQEGDLYRVGNRHFFVAPVRADMLEFLILAAAATEDFEEDDPGGGAVDDAGEPSLGQSGADLESDGLEDEVADCAWGSGGGEAALGWANEGSQESLGVPMADEAEPELGWGVSPQFRLADGYSVGDIRESDNDCDAEDDDPDHGIDDVPHDPDHDNESDHDNGGDAYRLTGRDSGYIAEARKRTAERPYDGRGGALKLVLAAMSRKGGAS